MSNLVQTQDEEVVGVVVVGWIYLGALQVVLFSYTFIK